MLLRNDFHGTSCRINNLRISKANVARIKAKLCPQPKTCKCSGPLGYRGPQDNRFDCNPTYNGGYRIEVAPW